MSEDREQYAVTPYSGMPVATVEQALARRNAMHSFVQSILRDGPDYGVIPGTDQKTLKKPGAEKLNTFFGLSSSFSIIEKAQDWTGIDHGGEPFFFYWYKCTLTRDGKFICDADGSCNSMESKYRYRWVIEADIPEGVDPARLKKRGGRISEPQFAIERGETTGKYGKPAAYWQEFRDAIERGEATPVKRKKKDGGEMNAWEIDSTVYRIPNDDMPSLVNTIQKMALKRALVGACLIATNASDYFTQDLEDFEEFQEGAAQAVEGEFKAAPVEKPTEGKKQAANRMDVADAMTAFWAYAKAKPVPDAEAAGYLKAAGNDPVKALADLKKMYP